MLFMLRGTEINTATNVYCSISVSLPQPGPQGVLSKVTAKVLILDETMSWPILYSNTVIGIFSIQFAHFSNDFIHFSNE